MANGPSHESKEHNKWKRKESSMSETERLDYQGAALYLGLAGATVRKYVSRRVLPYYKVGKLVRFTVSDLDSWLASRRVESAKGERK
jgi:excisionase family DNA binding protein